MAKSVSPSKAPRGRPKTKIPEAKKEEAARSKSRGRAKSRGRSPTPKAAKSRKSTTPKRAASKSRGRSQSKSRKPEPKPRGRSASRKSQPRKSVTAPKEKSVERTPPPSVGRPRRSVAAPPAPAAEKVTRSSLPVTSSAVASSKGAIGKFGARVADFCGHVFDEVKAFGYRRTFSAAWWLVSLPVFVLGLHLLCSKDNCYIRFNPTIPKTLRVYADPVVLSYGAGLVALQAILSAIPVGRVVSGFGYRRAGSFAYRCNSLLCLVVSVALYCVAVFYLRLPNTLILQTHRFKCVSAATLLAFLLTLVLYAKSFIRASPSHRNHGSPCSPGVQNNHLHDFVHGREISPKIGRTFDLGLVLLRSANCIWTLAVISACLQARSASGPVFGLSYSVALVAACQLAYVAVGSLNEVFLLKSAFIQQGVGFLSVFSTIVLTPFCATLPLRFLVDAKTADLCVFCYPALAALFVVGLVLIHYSNALKYNNARFGGKTLRNGPWAVVRHPNYLGELLCIAAWTLPCGKAALPFAHLAFVALLVICRSIQTEKNTNADYRSYQQQTRFRLLPPIF